MQLNINHICKITSLIVFLFITSSSKVDAQLPPFNPDPVTVGFSGLYNIAEVQPGANFMLSLPTNELVNIAAHANYFPAVFGKSVEWSYEGLVYLKFLRTHRLKNTFSVMGGFNRNQWQGKSITIRDQDIDSWNKSESYVLGLNYTVPIARAAFLNLEHKFYLDYHVQVSCVGVKFPIYRSKYQKQKSPYQYGKVGGGKKFRKKKTKLRLSKDKHRNG